MLRDRYVDSLSGLDVLCTLATVPTLSFGGKLLV